MAPLLLFDDRSPGRYAFTALAGALRGAIAAGQVEVQFFTRTVHLAEAARVALEQGRTALTCFSFYSPSFPEAVAALREVKAATEGRMTTLAGGVHATAEPGETLDAGFDWVCQGEGEHTLLEVVRRLGAGESLEGTPGLARRIGGHVVSGGKGPSVRMGEFAPFAPELERFGAIEITRGCIYACRFCQTPFLNKARFRHRPVDDVARWARELRASGRRDLRFISPTSLSYGSPDETPNLAAVEELLARCVEAMQPEGRVFFGTFPSELRPEHVTPESLRLLKRYVANDAVILGGQSGSDRVLEASHRGHDVEAIVRAVEVAVAEGFIPNVDFILGLPEEGPEELAQTVSLMERLGERGAKVHAHTFMPLPGTPFRRAAPGEVDEATTARLDRLASEGRLHGQWKRQVGLAAEIAKRRADRQAPTPNPNGADRS